MGASGALNYTNVNMNGNKNGNLIWIRKKPEPEWEPDNFGKENSKA